MNALVRASLLACLSIGMAGCAIVPVAGLVAQGAQGLVALTLGPLVGMQERSEGDSCQSYTSKGISVTESLEIALPRGEGVVTVFESVSWRPEFARDGYPRVERFRTPAEGALALSERAALFMPPPGTTSVRIPYELVQNVEIHQGDGIGKPRYMIVKSCFGRFDIVMFLRHQPSDWDPETTTAAVAELKSRVAAFRTAADN
jgi:hypothetical protein